MAARSKIKLEVATLLDKPMCINAPVASRRQIVPSQKWRSKFCSEVSVGPGKGKTNPEWQGAFIGFSRCEVQTLASKQTFPDCVVQPFVRRRLLKQPPCQKRAAHP